MTARLFVGDVFDRIREIPDGSVDLVCTSPPFLSLRKYGDDPAEMGSEGSPAAFIDALLALTAEFRRVLAPHGSLAIELGDTYSGSGGSGGDYNGDGLRATQPKFRQGTPRWDDRPEGQIRTTTSDPVSYPARESSGWPLPKSLCGIPGGYMNSLIYGWNQLRRDAPDSPAGQWRARNEIVWGRPNPPVGALGDKVRPATSYITIACVSDKRWFDLDAVRTDLLVPEAATLEGARYRRTPSGSISGYGPGGRPDQIGKAVTSNPAGAPPLDWWNPLADRIDVALRAAAAGGYTRADLFGGEEQVGRTKQQKETAGGRLIRDAWAAGEIDMGEVWTLPTAPYPGAHYATWPPALAKRLIEMMCPLKVCTVCGKASKRIVESEQMMNGKPKPEGKQYTATKQAQRTIRGVYDHLVETDGQGSFSANRTTLGWTDCGHDAWRQGHVLDPFAGSGTTLAVAVGCGRAATGIELYEANADLIGDRLGLFLIRSGDEGSD